MPIFPHHPLTVHTSTHTCCPWLSLLFHWVEPWVESQLCLCLWAAGREPSPLPGPGCPLGHCGQEVRLLGLNPALGPTEGSWRQEGPVPLPVHGPPCLHHSEAEVRFPAAQLHEPVSGQGRAGGLRKGGSFALPGPQHLLAPHRYTAASVIDTASKYKLLWKLPLEDADIIKGGADSEFLVLGSSSEKPSWRV